MLTGLKGVKYGLTVPDSKKKKPAAPKPSKLAAFGDDDSDDDHATVPQQLARQAASKKSDSKVADMHAAALAEDPSVFDYDGVYESIQETRAAPVAAARQNRSSKYIEGLLDKAQERQREQDIIFERRQVKERQVEDHLFGDKEKFVTSAYKKKLQEQQLWEAQQKIKDQRDAANAAEKLGHMGGFYGNLSRNVAFGGAKSSKRTAEATEEAASAAAEAVAASSADETAAATPAEQPAVGGEESAGAKKPQREGSAEQPRQAGSASPAAAPSDKRSADDSSVSAAADVDTSAKSATLQPEAQAKPAAPQRFTAAKHTDKDAATAARERYLARKRKAVGQPDEP